MMGEMMKMMRRRDEQELDSQEIVDTRYDGYNHILLTSWWREN